MMPDAPKIHPGALVPRPWDLLPAAIYRGGDDWLSGWRLRRADTLARPRAFHRGRTERHLPPDDGQSQRVLDAPYTLAHVLMVLSYVVVLGGTLLDNAQLFDQVSRMAALRFADRTGESSPAAGSARERNCNARGAPDAVSRCCSSISTD